MLSKLVDSKNRPPWIRIGFTQEPVRKIMYPAEKSRNNTNYCSLDCQTSLHSSTCRSWSTSESLWRWDRIWKLIIFPIFVFVFEMFLVYLTGCINVMKYFLSLASHIYFILLLGNVFFRDKTSNVSIFLFFDLSYLFSSGRKRNGSTPAHYCKADSSIIRKAIQALEALKLVEADAEGSVNITIFWYFKRLDVMCFSV